MNKYYSRSKKVSLGLWLTIVFASVGFQVLFCNPHSTKIVNYIIGSLTFSALLYLPLLFFEKISEINAQETIDNHLEQVTESWRKFLDEQQNDILNELAVLDGYLQLGKLEEAKNYIEFMAAEQSDKYNLDLFVDNPWKRVLAYHEDRADDLGIEFNVEHDGPLSFEKGSRRFFLRLIGRLLEYVFSSAANSNKPKVWLRLYWQNSRLVVEVEANYLVAKIGDLELAICRYIAQELGGTLRFKNANDQSKVTFTLKH